MTNQVIPEAVVEAAAKAYVGPGDTAWGDLTPMVRRIRIQKMRAALEAAAPHMLAAAWDEAIQLADDEGCLLYHQAKGLKAANPYRTAK